MKFILVDTSVWSMAFRKKKLEADEQKLLNYLISLIRKRYVIMIGPVRQEILSGISDNDKFIQLRDDLESFSDFEIST
ncbi:MAG TPA: PIN domain nuclease, partial [Treponema sp.]|nr:PIN domain nuclease [Treponema sp.]